MRQKENRVYSIIISLKVNIWPELSYASFLVGIFLQASFTTFKALSWVVAAFCYTLSLHDRTLLQ